MLILANLITSSKMDKLAPDTGIHSENRYDLIGASAWKSCELSELLNTNTNTLYYWFISD